MGLGDWIFLAVLLGIAAIGALLGFGKVLKFVTGGIVGIIISIILCYCFGGMILAIPFVSRLLSDLASHWAHIDFLVKIHLEIIIYYIALFIVAMVLRIVIVMIIKHIAESDVFIMKLFNRIFGAILFLAFAFIIMGLTFQIIQWIDGSTAASFASLLETKGPAILRPLYENNPMSALLNFITSKK